MRKGDGKGGDEGKVGKRMWRGGGGVKGGMRRGGKGRY